MLIITFDRSNLLSKMAHSNPIDHSKPVDFSASVTLARVFSLQAQDDDPRSGFQQQRHRVFTTPNGANITIAFPGEEFLRTYINKCFVHSVYDGLFQHRLVWSGYSRFDLMFDIGFDKTMLMFDTDKAEHREVINRLLQKFQNIRIEFYIGTKEGDQWFTTQTPHAVFGTGEHVIRILNQNGNHFEHIRDQELPPIQHLTEKQQLDALQRQLRLLQQAEMEKMQKTFSKMTLVTDARMEPASVHSDDVIEREQFVPGAQVNLSSSSSSSSAASVDQSMAVPDTGTDNENTVTKPDEKDKSEKSDEEIARELQEKLEQEEKDAEYARKVHYGMVD